MKKYIDLYKRHTGYVSHKWIHYLFIYQELLDKYLRANKPINLLEIGVQNGGSIQIWEKFLPKGSKIYCIDIDKDCAKLKFGENTTFALGNASKKSFWKKHFKDIKFDVILDDGSHISSEVMDTFNLLFLERLNFGGTYIVEDLHTSYWKEHFGGGFREPNTSMEFFKALADSQGVNYFQHVAKISKKEMNFLKEHNRQIKRVSFYDSICAIEKYDTELKRPFISHSVGKEVLIAEDDLKTKDTFNAIENIEDYIKAFEIDKKD